MLPKPPLPDPPSDDKRWKIVATSMRRLGNQPHALIEALHSLQQTFGFLDRPGLEYIAGTLHAPLSKVYGAATFYHHFRLKPKGRHTCIVCTGTGCYIKGANRLLEDIERKHAVKPGHTSADGEVSLLTARCFGACGLAPVVVLDDEVLARVTSEDVERKLAEVRGNVPR
jgi:bidirectional [NiFe] hydrogenase diaphorase subunit